MCRLTKGSQIRSVHSFLEKEFLLRREREKLVIIMISPNINKKILEILPTYIIHNLGPKLIRNCCCSRIGDSIERQQKLQLTGKEPKTSVLDVVFDDARK
ncbi:hypothetical protein AVEN_93775-1 [Araneus ventricosus]|uniref:Uncharacterized protein n=1 Tax=Araneus ventricosus TaxID=182803 RepID=A0A4Y2FUL3_ARAVE|nr:hypothetical protein AVEN_93775-1 [Araneus ventricosus]